MKGLKIIPMFLTLMALSFLGVLFVQANSDLVTIHLGSYATKPVAQGLVVLSSVFVGMCVAGIFCSLELLALYMQNKSLRRKIASLRPPAAPKLDKPLLENRSELPAEPARDESTDTNIEVENAPKSGRFNPL